MTDHVLRAIDAAVQANLCGCSCGQQIPDRGPSPDFVNEKHQHAWAVRGYRASGGKVAADWYDDLRRATDDLVSEAWRTAQPPTVRRGGLRFHIDGSDCPTPENCSACREARDDPDETPMARVVRETSTLRKAINKILGARL
jgi:hypothetical protein